VVWERDVYGKKKREKPSWLKGWDEKKERRKLYWAGLGQKTINEFGRESHVSWVLEDKKPWSRPCGRSSSSPTEESRRKEIIMPNLGGAELRT